MWFNIYFFTTELITNYDNLTSANPELVKPMFHTLIGKCLETIMTAHISKQHIKGTS